MPGAALSTFWRRRPRVHAIFPNEAACVAVAQRTARVTLHWGPVVPEPFPIAAAFSKSLQALQVMTDPRAPSSSLVTGEFLELIREGHWEYAHRTNSSGAVVLVPVTNEGCLVLIEQYRIPVHARVVELPAGLVGDEHGAADETIEDAARRELLEETGFHAWDLRATSGPPSAGMASEIVTFLLATRLERTGAAEAFSPNRSRSIPCHSLALSAGSIAPR